MNDGTVYATDRNFEGGSTAIFEPNVQGTDQPYVYRAERFGNFSYSIPLADGNYSLTLKFAEMYWTNPGQRDSVNAQGAPIIFPILILLPRSGQEPSTMLPFPYR